MDKNLKQLHLEFDDSSGPRPSLVALKSRYPWACALGLLGALAGGYAAYETWTPLYTGKAMVQVAPILPRVMFKNEDNSLMPMYDSYIASQAALLQSPKVLSSAIRRPEWMKLQRDFSESDFETFSDSVVVDSKRGSQIISVSFTDENPDAAVAGVNAVLAAYRQLYGESELKQREERITALEARKRADEEALRQLQVEIQQISEEVDSQSLELVYQTKLADRQRLEAKLEEIAVQTAGLRAMLGLARDKDAPASAGRQPGLASDTNAATATASQPTGIAAADAMEHTLDVAADRAELEALRQQKQALTSRLAEWRAVAKEEDPNVRSLTRQMVHIDERLGPLEEKYGGVNDAAVEVATQEVDPAVSAEQQLVMWEAQEPIIRERLARSKEDIKSLTDELQKLELLRLDLSDSRSRLKETEQRIDELYTESSLRGRITFVSDGSVSYIPSNRRQLKERLALGVVGGLTMGVGGVVLLGMFNPKCRNAGDARSSIGDLALIGIVPQLPRSLSDSEQIAAAARSVQQIRMQLQLLPQPCQVLTVTSPAPKDGKTSVAAALGLSFAAAGCRTLLVDFDLNSQGMTRHAGCLVQPRLGPLLLQEGMLTAGQLTSGLSHSARRKLRLGEALVALGTLREQQVVHALELQARARVGLSEVLNGGSLQPNVRLHAPNLDLLPVGSDGTELMGKLSTSTLAGLLDQARKEYAAIIIDTGPVLSSPEAQLLTAQCDGTLLVVGRGVQQRTSQRAVDFLQQIRANILGVVYNRATSSDLKNFGLSSGSGSSGGGARVRDPATEEQAADSSAASRFGPLAHATALSLPAPRENPASDLE
jgi:Mrp family chromosome partitioning ATPase/capsular polysaccharide biosynthesis protein